jgi:hypothetical protein
MLIRHARVLLITPMLITPAAALAESSRQLITPQDLVAVIASAPAARIQYGDDPNQYGEL